MCGNDEPASRISCGDGYANTVPPRGYPKSTDGFDHRLISNSFRSSAEHQQGARDKAMRPQMSF